MVSGPAFTLFSIAEDGSAGEGCEKTHVGLGMVQKFAAAAGVFGLSPDVPAANGLNRSCRLLAEIAMRRSA